MGGDPAAGDDRSRRADSARRRRTAADPTADYWERLRSMRPDSPGAEGGIPGDEGDIPREWERIRDARWSGEGPPAPAARAPSLSSLLMLLEAIRSFVPRELEQQFNALLREALLTLRALIDWYLERLEGGPRDQRVEDIPIE